MGNEICATDQQIRASISKEPSKFVRRQLSQFTPVLDKYNPFGDVICKKKPNTYIGEFVLQYKDSPEKEDVLQISHRIFPNVHSMEQDRKVVMELQNVLKDELLINNTLYRGSEGLNKLTYSIKPCDRLDDYQFKTILYYTLLNRQITSELSNHKNIHNNVEDFILQSGLNKSEGDKCVVIVKEQVSASMTEIIAYRKLCNWGWTQIQFELLLEHMLTALDALHTAGYAHNDIRPANIFYSTYKHAYMLGGFGFAKKHKKMQTARNIVNGIPFFMSPELRDELLKDHQQKIYNQFSNDIYALGLSLLSCFFLNLPHSPDLLIRSSQNYSDQYSRSLKIINQMIQKQNVRPTTKQLLQSLKSLPAKSVADKALINFSREDALIESLRYKFTPRDTDYIIQLKQLLKMYQCLFMNVHCQKINLQLMHYYELNHDNIQLAEIYLKIATSDIENEQYQQYFRQAYKLYLQLGKDSLQQYKYDQTVFYYNKALEAYKYLSDDKYQEALILKALADVHTRRSENDIAKTFLEESLELIGKSKGEESLQFADILVELAKNDIYYREYKESEKLLKDAIRILDLTQHENNPKSTTIKTVILEVLGNSLRLRAVDHDKQDVYREKAEKCFKQALEILEKEEKNDERLSSVHQSLGHLYFGEGSLHDLTRAKKQFQMALLVRKNLSKATVQIGITHIDIAMCFKHLHEYDKAIKDCNEAIQIFRKVLGNDHNHYTGVALGNLGLIYKQMGRQEQSTEYIGMALRILKEVDGEDSIDYRMFSHILN